MTSHAGKPDYTRLDLPEPPADRPYVLINVIMSADGLTVVEGTEAGIGSAVDQRLMRELRVNADAVLVGAETLRKSGASPRLGDRALEALRTSLGKPLLPTSAVLTRGGDLPLERPFFQARDEFEAVVFASEDIEASSRGAIETTGRRLVLLPVGSEIVAMLGIMRREMGVRVLLVEGGAELNRGLFDADAVDEYFATMGPVIVGGRHGLSAVGGAEGRSRGDLHRLELVSAYGNAATDEVYTRWRIRRAR